MMCKRIIALLIILNNQFVFAAEVNPPNEIMHLGIPFVQLPITVNPDEAILKLLNGDLPIVPNVKKAKITPGFGTKFDYSTILRQGEGKNEGVYKRRLKLLRSAMQASIDSSLIHDESIKIYPIQTVPYLKGFINAWELFKLTLSSIYAEFLKIDGFVPCFNSSQIVLETSVGKVVRGVNQNFYYLSEPDAQSIMFMFKKLQANKKTPTLKESQQSWIRLLDLPNLSEQAKRIIYYLINDAYRRSSYLSGYKDGTQEDILKSQTLKLTITNFSSQFTKEDQTKVNGVKANLSHFNDIDRLLHQVAHSLRQRETLAFRMHNTIYINKNLEDIFVTFQKYIPILDILQSEYLTIYERINDELRSKKKHHTGAKTKKTKTKAATTIEQPALNQPMVAEPILEPVKELPKISYDRRVKRWFRNSFTKHQPPNKVRYHTLLPLDCDPIVVAYGEHTLRPNATRKGQKDDNYRIAGLVDENNTKDFYIFEVCLDPKGICYHRGCKKTNYKDIESELGEIDALDQDELNDEVDVEAIDNQKANIIKDTELYAKAYNADCKCTITLYK